MNKRLIGLAGLAVILAACGSAGTAPDGSASLRISDVRTEYRTQGGTFVACDNTGLGGGTTTSKTAVATYFTAVGDVSSVDVGLRGVTSATYDANYNATFSRDQLASLGSNDYKVVFTADPAGSGFLPQGITVNPVNQPVYIKTVTTGDRVGAGAAFYAAVTVHTSSGQNLNTSSRYLKTVPVYTGCNVVATSTEKL